MLEENKETREQIERIEARWETEEKSRVRVSDGDRPRRTQTF